MANYSSLLLDSEVMEFLLSLCYMHRASQGEKEAFFVDIAVKIALDTAGWHHYILALL